MKKQSFIRLISFALLAVLAATAFVSCKGTSAGEDDSNSQESQSAANADGKIISDGIALYTVVYSKSASGTVKSEMEKFIDAVAQATGVTLESKSDEKKRSEIYDSGTKEILFGKTAYDETADVLSELKNGQFAIKQSGNKIVIVSKELEISEAVKYFCENLLAKNIITEASGKKSLIFEEYVSPIPQKNASEAAYICGESLSEYRIVYDASKSGYMEAAKVLQTTVEEIYGIKIICGADSAYKESTEKEILVGKTNRAFSEKCYTGHKTDIMTYKTVLENKTVQIVSGGPFSALQAASYVAFNVSKLTQNGEYFVTNLASDRPEITENADVRIMTSNILADRWVTAMDEGASAATPCVTARAEILAGILLAYKPDAVGLQEACDVWNKELPAYLEILKQDYGIEYTWIHNTYKEKLNMTSILYRSDKYDIVRSDAEPVSYWEAQGADYYIRLFAWVQLRERANPQNEFILLNTHWELSSRLEKVQMCINEERDLINNTLKGYGVPIICTGDFNSKQDTEDYYRFTREAGVTEMRASALENGTLINRAGGCGNVGTPRNANGGNYIDHIYGTSECDALRYETVITNMAYWMTDHSPQYTDIKFN